MRRWQRRPKRRGATVLETAILLMTFLTLTMGMLDLAIGVFRYHVLANAARHVARRAIVRGELGTALGIWNPASHDEVQYPATAIGIPIVDEAVPLLIGCDRSGTKITVDWLNDSHSLDQPVRVTITSPYTPIMSFILPSIPKTLTASSTMRIAH